MPLLTRVLSDASPEVSGMGERSEGPSQRERSVVCEWPWFCLWTTWAALVIHTMLLSHGIRAELRKTESERPWFCLWTTWGSLGHTYNALVAWHHKLAWERELVAMVLSVDVVGSPGDT